MFNGSLANKFASTHLNIEAKSFPGKKRTKFLTFFLENIFLLCYILPVQENYNVNSRKAVVIQTHSHNAQWAKQRIIDVHPLNTPKINQDFLKLLINSFH